MSRSLHRARENRGWDAMASWLHPEKKSNQNQVPPLQKKSRIPVRMTRLSRESDRGSLSENEAANKARLQRISVSKLQNKRPSRIPIVVDERKNNANTKGNLTKNVKTTRGEMPLGKNSGMCFSIWLASLFHSLHKNWRDLRKRFKWKAGIINSKSTVLHHTL